MKTLYFALFGLLISSCSSTAIKETDLAGHAFAAQFTPLNAKGADSTQVLAISEASSQLKRTYSFKNEGKGTISLLDQLELPISWAVTGDSLIIDSGGAKQRYKATKEPSGFVLMAADHRIALTSR